MLTNSNSNPKQVHPWRMSVIVFMVTALFSTLLIWQLELQRREATRAQVYGLVQDHARATQETMDRALSATYALAAVVQQGHGKVDHFEEIATKMLPFYPGVSALNLAPGGVISHAMPLAGNEKAIGLDLLKDPSVKNEARMARDSGKLTLAGPF